MLLRFLFVFLIIPLYGCDDESRKEKEDMGETVFFVVDGCVDGSKSGYSYGSATKKRINYKSEVFTLESYEFCNGRLRTYPVGEKIEKYSIFDTVAEMEGRLRRTGQLDMASLLKFVMYEKIIKMYYTVYDEKNRIGAVFSEDVVESFDSISKTKALPLINIVPVDKSGETFRRIGMVRDFIYAGPMNKDLSSSSIREANSIYVDFYNKYIKNDTDKIQIDLSYISKLFLSGVEHNEISKTESIFNLISLLKMRIYMDKMLYSDFSKFGKKGIRFNYIKGSIIAPSKMVIDVDIINTLSREFDKKYWFWNEGYAASFGDIPLLNIPITLINRHRDTKKDKRPNIKRIVDEERIQTDIIKNFLKYNSEYMTTLQGASTIAGQAYALSKKIGFSGDIYQARKIYLGSYRWELISSQVEEDLETLISSGAIRTRNELSAAIDKIVILMKVDDYKKILSVEKRNSMELSLGEG